MTQASLIVGNCPSRDAKHGRHRLSGSSRVTYHDCRGRSFLQRDGFSDPKNPLIFSAVANCVFCLKPLVLFNGGFPTSVTWIRPWRELVDESELIEHHVIEEGMF